MVVNNVKVVSVFAGSIYADTCHMSGNKWNNITRPAIIKKPTHQGFIDEDTSNISGYKLKNNTPRTPPSILKKPSAKQIFR